MNIYNMVFVITFLLILHYSSKNVVLTLTRCSNNNIFILFFRKEGSSHQKTIKCIHVVHEGNETSRPIRMYTQRICCYKPNPWSTGKQMLIIQC